MTAARGRSRAGLAVPVLFVLAAVTTFIALGTWQLERKAWKETLIAQFPSNADNAFRQGVFIGDYSNNEITNDGTVYAVWTGVTPGKFDSDIFIATFKT